MESSLSSKIHVEVSPELDRWMRDTRRYLHMNPKFMDDDGLVTGRTVKEGEIIEKGNHQSLLAQNGFYHRLYMSQFKKQEELVSVAQ